MASKQHTAGRPKTKGALRNFKFRKKLDDFLVDERALSGRDMTQILEVLLLEFSKLKPSARSAALDNGLRELGGVA